jgi:hypothetical protein
MIFLGAAAGVLAWLAFAAIAGSLPVWIRFVFTAAVFTFGPGAGAAGAWLSRVSVFHRIVLSTGFGVALAPVLGHVLGTAGLLAAYPYVAAALAGGALAHWRANREPLPRTSRHTALAASGLVLVAVLIGTVAFANRLTTTQGTTTVYGNYDSYDLTYYAEIAAELSHTVPPASPFYTGRMLNHAFYPHVLLGMVHRFGDVPILDLYFRYAWPAFLVAAVLMCFIFVESISTVSAAFVTALLFMAGSNFGYLAKWILKPEVWDDVIWGHNLQGATSEPLLYNNWTPALIALFAALYALQKATGEHGRPWAILAGVTLATTVLAKPWVFASVLAAMAMCVLVGWREVAVRRRLLLAAAAAVIVSAPLLYRTITLFEDSQVVFEPAFFPIPLVMANRIGLRDWFIEMAAVFGSTGAMQIGVASLLAAPLFLAGSLGYRLVGLTSLWRCLRRPAAEPFIWRVLAWTVLAAFGASTFIVSVPYHEITQVHQFVLFMMTMFAGRSLASLKHSRVRWAATAVVIAIAVPCTVQYLHRKWTDSSRPLAQATPGDVSVASLLRNEPPERTVILHSQPNEPALVGILAERRSVLAWAGYVRGSNQRRAEVDAFFASPDYAAAEALVRAYRPTHVIETEGRDRMNPELRALLDFVSRADGVALYRVPVRFLQ